MFDAFRQVQQSAVKETIRHRFGPDRKLILLAQLGRIAHGEQARQGHQVTIYDLMFELPQKNRPPQRARIIELSTHTSSTRDAGMGRLLHQYHEFAGNAA